MLKSFLIQTLLLLCFTLLFLAIAIFLHSPNPIEFVYHIFASIGMLHWINSQLLKDNS